VISFYGMLFLACCKRAEKKSAMNTNLSE
jgi:hypothetical protein